MTDRSFDDFVVPHDKVVVNHHVLDHSWHNRRFDVGSRKLTDRLDGGPLGDDQELDAFRRLTPEDGCAQEAGDAPDRRERLGPQMINVRFGVLALGQASPLSGGMPLLPSMWQNEAPRMRGSRRLEDRDGWRGSSL